MKNVKSNSYITDLKFSSMFRARKKGKKSNPVIEGNIFTTSDWGKRIYNLQSGGKLYADINPESISMNTGVLIEGYTGMYIFTGDIVKVFTGPGDIYHDITVFCGTVKYYDGAFGVAVVEEDIDVINGFDSFTQYKINNKEYIIPLIDILNKGYKVKVIG